MKTGLSITELAAKIEANKEMKRDYIADTSSMTMQIDRSPGEPLVTALEFPDPESKGHLVRFPVLETTHDQIGDRLGIPAKYYDRMRSEAPDLLAVNVNAWFRKNPERRMVRTLGGDARAFLSNRYQRIENEEIAEVALPVLLNIPGLKVISCGITERRMYIQAATSRVTLDVKVGDAVQAGVIISNSEVGKGSVSIQALLYRLRCLNGMIAPDGGLRAYHVGGRVESSEELWKDDTRKADDRAILLKIRDTVQGAMDEAQFAKRVDKLRGLTEVKVIGNPEKAVEVLAKKVGATETERGGILRALIEGGDLSAWGLLNAVTAQAHTAGNYDRSVEMEAAGGALIDLPASEWKHVLEAA